MIDELFSYTNVLPPNAQILRNFSRKTSFKPEDTPIGPSDEI